MLHIHPRRLVTVGWRGSKASPTRRFLCCVCACWPLSDRHPCRNPPSTPHMAGSLIPTRTPKTGWLRKWILLPDRKKALVLLLAAAGVMMFARIALAPSHSYEVRHVLTEGATHTHKHTPWHLVPVSLLCVRWMVTGGGGGGGRGRWGQAVCVVCICDAFAWAWLLVSPPPPLLPPTTTPCPANHHPRPPRTADEKDLIKQAAIAEHQANMETELDAMLAEEERIRASIMWG